MLVESQVQLDGGIKMNAGAYDGQMSDVVDEIIYLNEEDKIVKIKNKDANFGYRNSIFKQNDKLVILSATFKLKKGEIDLIDAKMKSNALSRKTKQPIELPSAGSVFKRPTGYFVGPMIIECGLQGKKIGGAQVSTKHAGFIVNVGGATCKDICDLIKLIKTEVNKKFNVELETEIQFIGGKK